MAQVIIELEEYNKLLKNSKVLQEIIEITKKEVVECPNPMLGQTEFRLSSKGATSICNIVRSNL